MSLYGSVFEAEAFERSALQTAFRERMGVALCFGKVELLASGEKRGRFRLKEWATIVEAFGGNFVSSDFGGEILNFEFIVADEWAVKRQARDRADCLEIAQSLRGDLAETVARDEAFGFFAKCKTLRDAQHETAIEKSAEGFVSASDDFALQRFEGNEIKFCAALPGNKFFEKAPRDVNGRFAGLGTATPEMDKAEMRATLHHFVRGDCRIETAAEEAGEAAGGVRGQPAGTGNAAGVNQNGAASNFDAAREIGMF